MIASRIEDCEDAKLQDMKEEAKNYKGFVGGVFSGIAKLTGKLAFFEDYIIDKVALSVLLSFSLFHIIPPFYCILFGA